METKYLTEQDLFCIANLLHGFMYPPKDAVSAGGATLFGCNGCENAEACHGDNVRKKTRKLSLYPAALKHLYKETGLSDERPVYRFLNLEAK